MRRFGKQPFAWNEKKAADRNHTSDDLENHNTIEHESSKHNKNATNDGGNEAQTCRNSVQGRIMIADDQGMDLSISFICFQLLKI